MNEFDTGIMKYSLSSSFFTAIDSSNSLMIRPSLHSSCVPRTEVHKFFMDPSCFQSLE